MKLNQVLMITALALAWVLPGIKPTPAVAAGEILVFNGTQESMNNVAYTIKPEANGQYQVYRGAKANNVQEVLLTLQADPRMGRERIYRGHVTTGANVLYTVVESRTAKEGYLITPGAGTSIVKASYTLDRSVRHICIGFKCKTGSIAYTWASAPDHNRMWLYAGRKASGIDNVRFTVRGPLGEAMALLPVLAAMP